MFGYIWDLFTGLISQRVVYLFVAPVLLGGLLMAALISAKHDPSFEVLGRALVYGTLGLIGLVAIVLVGLAIEWGAGNATRTDPDEVPTGGRPSSRPTRRIKRTRREGSISDWQVREKAGAARAILRFLAVRDPAFDEAELVRRLTDVVRAVREAQDDANLKGVAKVLGPDLYRTLCAELDERTADGRWRRFRPVSRVDVSIVLVDVPADPARHRMTAVVTTKSRDYVLDLAGKELLHGDPDEAVLAQAFWIFVRDGKRWRAEQVRPPEDADDLCCLLNQISAELYEAFRQVGDPVLKKEVSAYPAATDRA